MITIVNFDLKTIKLNLSWSPFLLGDIKKIEKGSRASNKRPLWLQRARVETNIRGRLRRLNLTKLKDRRIREDIIKIVK